MPRDVRSSAIALPIFGIFIRAAFVGFILKIIPLLGTLNRSTRSYAQESERPGEIPGSEDFMNLRSICICLGITGATLALAAGVLKFTEGRGTALSENGRRANFQFNARKLTSGDH